ncbi:MAG: glutamate--tRNA ligase [Bacteroidota bacterium]
MAKEVRVRFAPSPTGGLHIGGVRTALYNYLYARNQGGKFILRIEDTDQSRKVEGAEEYIVEALKWCGLEPDESPFIGGEYGPYRQSERLDIYQKYVDRLINEGKAYYAFDTPEELEAMRKELQEQKADVQQYGISNRMKMRNSLTLSDAETKNLLENNTPYVIRVKVPEDQTIVVNDIIRGEVKVDSNLIDDKILLKSDGFPTYHLANVVDDYLMKITHVIRGEEWLPSAPLHVLLYDLLDWSEDMPAFAHMSLLLKPEGSGKLSKRDAEKHGFPIFPITWHDPRTGAITEGFREQGYISGALINFLALLGWYSGSDEEVFTIEELAKIFRIEGINKSGAKFEIEKAKWYNEIYLRKEPKETLATNYLNDVNANGHECSSEKATDIIDLLIERVTFYSDFWKQGKFFFVAPETYDEKTARKKWDTEIANVLIQFSLAFAEQNPEKEEDIKQLLWETGNANGMGIGKLMPGLRLAMTGEGGGPDLMGILRVLGANEVRNRIVRAADKLG